LCPTLANDSLVGLDRIIFLTAVRKMKCWQGDSSGSCRSVQWLRRHLVAAQRVT
jgi:hypothetical protein